MDYIIMNIKEIVQTPYTTSPRFTPIDSVKFKVYLQEAFEERLKEYNILGAKFTKWRGVYTISKNYPSKLSIESNAHALARYSALVQEVGMVPIIEPEVLMDG